MANNQMTHFVLKEWAILCHALATGQQDFIARKGGLQDEGDVFVKLPKEFYLQATYFHENKQQIKPAHHELFDEVTRHAPPADRLHLGYVATRGAVTKITTLKELKVIGQKSWLTEDYLKNRFDYGTTPSLWIIELKVERLSPPLILPMKKEYRGCQSGFWL
jgi:hypothetical protein